MEGTGKDKSKTQQLADGAVQLDLKLPRPEKDAAKRDRYDWEEIKRVSRRAKVSKHMLALDARYQRDATSNNRILDYAKHWDERKAGRLLVAQREDGSLWVVDGGNRLRAAMLRDDVAEVECDIFNSTGVEEEARIFASMAREPDRLSSHDAYHADLAAGDDVCTKVARILAARGWTARKSNVRNNLLAIGTFRSLVDTNDALAERVFDLCIEAQRDGERIENSVLTGVFYLARRMADRRPPVDILAGRDREKLVNAGLVGIHQAIKVRLAAEAPAGGGAVFARGVLAIINKHRRTKLAWVEE